MIVAVIITSISMVSIVMIISISSSSSSSSIIIIIIINSIVIIITTVITSTITIMEPASAGLGGNRCGCSWCRSLEANIWARGAVLTSITASRLETRRIGQ